MPRVFNKQIRTRKIFHAAVLINCGAQLIDIEELENQSGTFEIVLGLELLDKRGAAKRFKALSEDLSGENSRGRTLRDILNDSILTDIETMYYRLRSRVRDLRDGEFED